MGNVNEWLYICSKCGHQITDGIAFYGECPDCHASSWMCHLISQDDSKSKISGFQVPDPIETHDVNLSQGEEFEMRNFKRDKLTFQPQKKKPGPKPLLLKDLIRELANRGLSSRGIARELNERGISVSYKTIQRRLQSSSL